MPLRGSTLHRLLIGLLLGWTMLAGLFLAWRQSMTTDEDVHVASGYLALTRHDFRFDPEHPFLFKALTALPLLVLRPALPPGDQQLWEAGRPMLYDSWQEAREWADRWFYRSGNNADLMLFLARLPAVLCLVALAWMTYYLGRLWFSKQAGLYALFFTAFNPTLLAHGSLANDDVPLALAFLLALLALWRYRERPSLRTAVWAGIACGASQLVKSSALALIPIGLAWMWYVGPRLPRRQRLQQLGAYLLATYLVIWLAYGGPFQQETGVRILLPIPDNLYYGYVQSTLIWLQRPLYLARYFIPVDYLKGLFLVAYASHIGRPAFLLNTYHLVGFWYYFPLLYLMETQLAGLLALGLGIAVAWGIGRRQLAHQPAYLLLLLTILVFGGLSVTSKLDIGIRHIAPLLAIASLYMGLGTAWLAGQGRQKTLRSLARLLPALYALPVLAWLPYNLLGYANLTVPPSRAYAYLDDSNLDWGQESRQIAQLVHDLFGNPPLSANYPWNPYVLSYYGLDVRPFDPSRPPLHALILLTATQLDMPEYQPFRPLRPLYVMDGIAFFYRLDQPLLSP